MSSLVNLSRTRTRSPDQMAPKNAARVRRERDTYDALEPLLRERAALPPDSARREVLRESVIVRGMPLAEYIARRFAGRGGRLDDLLRAARTGLLEAIDRFDPEREATFLAVAVPTIVAQVRRGVRATRSARVPQRIEQIHQRLEPATAALTRRIGRVPRAREIAEELGLDTTEVIHAMVARNHRRKRDERFEDMTWPSPKSASTPT